MPCSGPDHDSGHVSEPQALLCAVKSRDATSAPDLASDRPTAGHRRKEFDRTDRSINPTEFAAAAALTRSFTLDACANPDGSNALCSNFCSTDRSFLEFSAPQLNEHIWLNPPYQDIYSFVRHYVELKRSRPDISACLLLPDWPGKFNHLLRGMRLLKTYARGTVLFEAPATPDNPAVRVALPGIPFACHLYYDPPVPVSVSAAAADDETPAMIKTGTLAGYPLRVGFDSWASHNFLDRQWCDQAGVIVTPYSTDSEVTLADGNAKRIYGTCTLRLALGPYQGRVPFYVVDLAHECLLGQTWFVHHRASLHFAPQPSVQLYKGDRKMTLLCDAMNQYASPAVASKPVLSALQFKRAYRKVRHCFVVQVKCNPDTGEVVTNVDGLVPQADLDALLAKYVHVAPAELPAGLPPHRGTPHVIPLVEGAQPPPSRMYRLSPREKAEVEAQIKELLAKGLIEPSSSPFGAPVIFVPKPDGSLRMCIDYRALNRITVKNKYPLPRIDDLLDQLSGATVFSGLDLVTGYYQLRMKEEDIPKTAFRTHIGLYQWRVLSLGLANAPSTFQSAMNEIFADYIGKFVCVYLDDILVYSRTPEEHLEHLECVLKRLADNQLYLKLKKCTFNQPEIKFLGHIVGKGGVRPDPAKVAAVQQWPVPADLHQLRQFLGLTNYFKRHIMGYSSLVLPLTNQLSTKSGSHAVDLSSPACRSAFEAVKHALCTAPALGTPDFTKPFEVVCDASKFCLGGVLFQKGGKPISYETRKLLPAERNYHAGERELLAVVHCLKVWRCYLEGSDFTVVTDHNPLTWFATQPTLSPRQARWEEFLSRFDFTWEYRPGRINVADPLSRRPDMMLAMITRSKSKKPAVSNTKAQATAVAAEAPVDVAIQPGTLLHVIALASVDVSAAPTGFKLSHGVYVNDSGQIYVPEGARDRCITEHHDAPAAGGHRGVAGTVHLIQNTYWWPRMWKSVETYVRGCDTCQRSKARNVKPAGKLQSLPIPTRKWGSVSMDFIVSLPRTKAGFDAIMVVVDRLTKFARFIPTTSNYDAPEVARLFVEHVYANHGMPDELITDRDKIFVGGFWKSVAKQLQITHKMSTAFHPQTDGQTERTNRTLQQYLRCYVNPAQDDWDDWLPLAQFAYNNARQESTGYSPFYLTYGLNPVTPSTLGADSVVSRPSHVPSADAFVESLDTDLRHARQVLERAQQRQKSNADTRRSPAKFSVGDKVLLSTANIRLKSGTSSTKLLPRYIGPFKVLARIGEVAYKLELPACMKIHPVFHVSLLSVYHDNGQVQPPPPPSLVDDELLYDVEHVLQHRDRKYGRGVRREYLIKWQGYGHEHNTWEPEKHLNAAAKDSYWAAFPPT